MIILLKIKKQQKKETSNCFYEIVTFIFEISTSDVCVQ